MEESDAPEILQKLNPSQVPNLILLEVPWSQAFMTANQSNNHWHECRVVLKTGAQVSDLYDPREQWASFVINALKAKELQIRDVNYIVRDSEVCSASVQGRMNTISFFNKILPEIAQICNIHH